MLEASHNNELPVIPGKRYFTIGEVSELCAVKPHVLRYWEQEFPQLKPIKRRGNRRYYQRHDVLLIRQIRSLLYEHGFTIGGARLRLTGNSSEALDMSLGLGLGLGQKTAKPQNKQLLLQLRTELEDIMKLLDTLK
jgi:DNA-binding transcriptional MerR regulator